MSGLLDGLRVVDCSWGMAGPKATGILADYGADVIWVEPPGGDPWRRDLTIPYSAYNRNKRSIVLDLHDEAGRATFFELLETADVFVESWQPGTADRLGIGYEAVNARIPSLVYCSISGYGADDPRRDLPGYEALVHSVMGTMGEQFGHREGTRYSWYVTPDAPTFIGLPFASAGAANVALIGTLAALYRREADGWGRHVETSLLDGVLAYFTQEWGYAENPNKLDVVFTRYVNRMFRCGDDEYVGVCTFARGAFDRMIQVLGIGDRIRISDGTADLTLPLSPEERDVVDNGLHEIFATQPRAVWIERLLAADVCAMPVLHPGEVFDEPQARHNDMVVEVVDPELGRIEQVAPPTKFAATPGAVHRPAPRLGEHTDEILDELRRGVAGRGRVQPGVIDDRPLLDGVRILDLGHWYAGPFASRLLADLGADVVKLEPTEGDPMRGFERAFSAAQSGKRSIAADLKDPELASLRNRLVEWADVVQHNLRPGVVERLGLGYDDVQSIKSDAIYFAAPAWGTSGPNITRQSFATLMSSFVGVAYEVAGQFNPPISPRANEDSGAGMLGAVSVLMALVHRARTGRGQYLELPQLNATMSDLKHVMRTADGEVLGAGALDPLQLGTGPLHRLYETADGWVCLVAATDAEVGALGKALDLDLLGDERFATWESRRAHAYALERVLTDAFAAEPTATLVPRLQSLGVPVAEPALDNNYKFMDDPENLRSGRVAELVHPRFGRVREPAMTFRVDRARIPTHRRAPELGEHTDAIIAWAGYTPSDAARLRDRNAIR